MAILLGHVFRARYELPPYILSLYQLPPLQSLCRGVVRPKRGVEKSSVLSVLAFEFPLSTKRCRATRWFQCMLFSVLSRTVGACHTPSPRSDEPELWLALGAVVLRWDSESSCFFQFCLHRQATIWGRPSHRVTISPPWAGSCGH